MRSSSTSPSIPNPGYDKTRATLIECGFTCLRTIIDTPERGVTKPDDRLEVWAGGMPTQMVIVQVWKDGNGCATYTNKGMGSTFDELKASLST